MALAKVEEAYRREKETKELVRQAFESFPLHDLQDTLDADEDGTEENRLLPAMNKIWPFLVACFRNRNPVVRDLSLPLLVSLNQHGNHHSKLITFSFCVLLLRGFY